MTVSEISALDPFEGFPNVYNRVDMNLIAFVKNEEGIIQPKEIQA